MVVEPTHLKKNMSQSEIMFPQFCGVNKKDLRYLRKTHHLGDEQSLYLHEAVGKNENTLFVPFHLKNLPKGRNLTDLEDPGITVRPWNKDDWLENLPFENRKYIDEWVDGEFSSQSC